jgi:hypothetical protein
MTRWFALRSFLVGLVVGTLTVAVTTAHAQPATAWADPTRPAGIVAAEGGASTPRAARPASAASAAAPAAPQLQSVQVGANGQASALVDGRVVQAGDNVGSSRIVAIDVDGLTLRDAAGRTVRMQLISAAIAKRNGGPAVPMASASNSNLTRSPSAALTSGAAVSAGSLGRGGHEGQRP